MGGGAASLLLLAGLFALRTHIGSNLELTARAVAYTVEAALVFRDAEDVQQTLARMLASEGGGGRRRARCSRSGSAARRGRVRAWVPRWCGWSAASRLCPPILFGSVAVGQVALHGDGQGMLNFLLSGVAVLLLCTAVAQSAWRCRGACGALS